MNRSAMDRRLIGRFGRGRRRCMREGFSLLEVILALAILVAALAVLGELVRSGIRNAQTARDLSRAQILCESKLAEVFAGLVAPENVGQAAYPDEPGWRYSIEKDATGPQGMFKIHVTVEQDPAEQRYPVQFKLVQWMRDPMVTATQLTPPVSASSQTSGSSQGGSSQSSGASSTGQGR